MKYLLDTHVIYWLALEPSEIPGAILSDLADPQNQLYASAISAYEVGNKVRLGKWPQAITLAATWLETLSQMSVADLSVSTADASLAASLPWQHRDPFDRLLAAQAINQRLTLVSADSVFSELPGLSLQSIQ